VSLGDERLSETIQGSQVSRHGEIDDKFMNTCVFQCGDPLPIRLRAACQGSIPELALGHETGTRARASSSLSAMEQTVRRAMNHRKVTPHGLAVLKEALQFMFDRFQVAEYIAAPYWAPA